jgi:phasin
MNADTPKSNVTPIKANASEAKAETKPAETSAKPAAANDVAPQSKVETSKETNKIAAASNQKASTTKSPSEAKTSATKKTAARKETAQSSKTAKPATTSVKTGKTAAASKSAASKTTPKKVKQTAQNPTEIFPMNEIFQLNTAQLPDNFRNAAESGLKQARDSYAKIRTMAEDNTELLEKTFETGRNHMISINAKALDTMQSNTDAVFSFWKSFMGVKSLSEAVELQSSFAKERFDAATKQTKEMQDAVKKMAEETSKPVQDAVNRSMKEVKAA